MRATHLYNQIAAIRLTASLLYDKAKAEGHSTEQASESIAPLQGQLQTLIAHAAGADLPGIVMAIKMFESEALKHEHDAKFLLNKAEDTRRHAETLRQALKADLVKNNENVRQDQDFTVTLVGDQLTIR